MKHSYIKQLVSIITLTAISCQQTHKSCGRNAVFSGFKNIDFRPNCARSVGQMKNRKLCRERCDWRASCAGRDEFVSGYRATGRRSARVYCCTNTGIALLTHTCKWLPAAQSLNTTVDEGRVVAGVRKRKLSARMQRVMRGGGTASGSRRNKGRLRLRLFTKRDYRRRLTAMRKRSDVQGKLKRMKKACTKQRRHRSANMQRFCSKVLRQRRHQIQCKRLNRESQRKRCLDKMINKTRRYNCVKRNGKGKCVKRNKVNVSIKMPAGGTQNINVSLSGTDAYYISVDIQICDTVPKPRCEPTKPPKPPRSTRPTKKPITTRRPVMTMRTRPTSTKGSRKPPPTATSTPQTSDDCGRPSVMPTVVKGGRLVPTYRLRRRRQWTQRILGGSRVARESYPWMVMTTSAKSRYAVSLCGGTLVAANWVLSASHCRESCNVVDGEIVGKCKLVEAKDITVTFARFRRRGAKPIRVKRIVDHPKRVPELNAHDIVLYELEEAVPFTKSTRPICLPEATADYSNRRGEYAVATGWGETNMKWMADSLQQVVLPLVPHDKCTYNLIQGEMCAGGERAKDTCTGDSGGPLQMFEGGRFVLAGVVSTGTKCGMEGWPAVYTHVATYRRWIQQHIGF